MKHDNRAKFQATWRFCFIMSFVILTALTRPAQAIDLFGDSLPQAQKNTCQSYAIMLALAAQGDAAFPIINFGQLRQAEAEFRGLAESISGGPYGHGALQEALDRYTGGRYRLEIETISGGIVEWMSRVKDLTRIESTQDVLLAQLTGTNFPVVLTSVTQFDSSTYGTGHIMAVLGIAGNGLNSDTSIVAFNSAVKGGGSINRCEDGTQPGDMRYTAAVVSTNNFTLKEFPGYRIFYLVRN